MPGVLPTRAGVANREGVSEGPVGKYCCAFEWSFQFVFSAFRWFFDGVTISLPWSIIPRPPRRTGRAELPHPALSRCFPRRWPRDSGRRFSNPCRSCAVSGKGCAVKNRVWTHLRRGRSTVRRSQSMAESHWVFRRNPMTYNASNGNGEFDNNSVCLAAHRHQNKIDDPTESK